jgi:hypothetical protein
MEFPDTVLEFTEEAIVLGHSLLPSQYPEEDDLGLWQSGLPDEAGGGRWCVVCRSEAGQMYIVDLTDDAHPVSVVFDTGLWEPLPVADSLSDFTDLLVRLQDLEADPRAAASWLETHFDPDHELWAEVAEGYRVAVARLETMRWTVEPPLGIDLGDDDDLVPVVLGSLTGLDLDDVV